MTYSSVYSCTHSKHNLVATFEYSMRQPLILSSIYGLPDDTEDF